MMCQNTLLELLLLHGVSEYTVRTSTSNGVSEYTVRTSTSNGVSDYAIRTSTTKYTAVTFSQITQICFKLRKFCSKMRTEYLRYKDLGYITLALFDFKGKLSFNA